MSNYSKFLLACSLGWLVYAPLVQAITLAEAAAEGDIAEVQSLLDAGQDPDSSTRFDTPALHWLVRLDEMDAVQRTLEAGADVNFRTRYGVTALELAVKNQSVDMTRLLLDQGADATVVSASGESLLMQAAEKGNVDLARSLVNAGADVDFRDAAYNQTALMFASRAGNTAMVAYLIEEGADPDASTLIGKTPNFVGPNSVPGFGFGVGIIRGGVPADRGRREPIPGGMTPLLYAARNGHTEAARVLLEAGAEINKAEANGIYPLLMAISNDNAGTARYLVEQGSALDDSDWYGRTPLWEAVNVRNLYLHNETYEHDVDRKGMLDTVRLLLEKGADVNPRTKETPPFRHHLLSITGSLEWVDFTGQTPFLTAALSGDITVMKLLLEYDADPLIDTFEGTSALMAAAGINWVVAQTYDEGAEHLLEAVELCYSLGMDVNQTNSMGLAAIHGAANRGSNDIILFLVDKGADLTLKDNEGRTPLDWAKGVFLATHPNEAKPESVILITGLLQSQNREVD